MDRVDLHQHVWTEPLLDALAARSCPPLVRRTGGLTVLHAPGELPCVLHEATEAPAERTRLLDLDGVDRAVVAMSSPVGIEMLAADAARGLIAAHLDGVLALGKRFTAWGPIPIRAADPRDVDAVLARGCIGVSLPAGALGGRAAATALLPALARVQEHGVPVFVHPGGLAAREPGLDEPLWWTGLTDYVAEMQTAWLTFVVWVRRELPQLRTVFAMLAGAAPLHGERLAARGGPALDLGDPHTFYDTSSYGPRMVGALARVVGSARLVHGSDRPVIEPVAHGQEATLMENSAQLLATAGARA
ncbi:MAG: amidohydrolase family protein [Solirubrobacterales bacterium]|nr:amidohydrolase family protein [Solirubrobacterales bacterium]